MAGAAADTVALADATAAAEVEVEANLRVLRPRLAARYVGRRTEFGSGRTLRRSLSD